jgi:hypothetical protein
MKVGEMIALGAFNLGPNGYQCPECGADPGANGWDCGFRVKGTGQMGLYEISSPCATKTTTVVVTAQKPKAGDVVHRSQIPHYNPGKCCPFCGETKTINHPTNGVSWACGLEGRWDGTAAHVCENYTIITPCSRYNPMPTSLKVGDVINPMVPMVSGGNCPVCGETKSTNGGAIWLCGGSGTWVAGKKNQEYRIKTLCSKVGGVAPMPAGVLNTYREPVPTTCKCETLLGGCTCGAFQREKDEEIRRLALSKLTETERKVLGVG